MSKLLVHIIYLYNANFKFFETINLKKNKIKNFFEKKEGKKKILENNRLVHKI